MPARSSWKGFLKLSLVSVPVKAYTANATSGEVRLNQLHQDCHNRIKYKKVCPEHGEISSDQIVSGYEYAKGQYVVVDPAELQKIRPQSDRSVNIHGFVPADQIDPLYFAGKNYYLTPDGAVGQKPYALLHKAMVEDGLVAVAEIILSGREQLVILRPLDKLLAMTGLAYAGKVKKPDAFRDEVDATQVSKEEMKLTRTIIEASTIQDFDVDDFRDTYIDNLTSLIQAKVEGQEIVAVPDTEEPKIINLMEALKESVAKLQSDKAVRKKKMAPSSKSTKTRRKKSGS